MFHLFQAYGVELEYMIVDARTLDVLPVADRLLRLAAEAPGAEAEVEPGSDVPGEVSLDGVSWSNELCLHVLEMKTSGPARSLAGLGAMFQRDIARANTMLAREGAALLPTAMHPWMDPAREMKLWPHGYGEVYAAFDRIFGCTGHGWSNLQSVHLNLPFQGDDEFGRLHSAIRAVLPIMPAIAASSPIVEGKATGLLDNRLEVYRHNSRRVPSIAGRVIPEQVATQAEYERVIFRRIENDLRPLDPDGVLEAEWVNARGCIARFVRSTIEVRVLDVQECPASDLAVVAMVEAAIRALTLGVLGRMELIRALKVDQLEPILLETIRHGDRATVSDAAYLSALGLSNPAQARSAGEVWRELVDRTLTGAPHFREVEGAVSVILRGGCLARRISEALGGDVRREHLREVYARLARCLAGGEPLRP